MSEAVPELKGCLIYPWMPERCVHQVAEGAPKCGCSLYGVEVDPGLKRMVAAGELKPMRGFACEHGHRLHVYEDALDRSEAAFREEEVVDS